MKKLEPRRTRRGTKKIARPMDEEQARTWMIQRTRQILDTLDIKRTASVWQHAEEELKYQEDPILG